MGDRLKAFVCLQGGGDVGTTKNIMVYRLPCLWGIRFIFLVYPLKTFNKMYGKSKVYVIHWGNIIIKKNSGDQIPCLLYLHYGLTQCFMKIIYFIKFYIFKMLF